MKPFIFMIFTLTLVLSACATPGDQPLTVTDAWARPALNGQNSAIYFMIENPRAKTDSLLSAVTAVAESTELHKSMMNAEGVMSMQPQAAVEVPAKSQVEFKPGGLHVMLINLKQDLMPGDTLDLVLNFKDAGEVKLSVPVKEPQ
jgi:hypothetical protein